jgi:glycosyltransferase involved in cell wall biosynthesis
MAEPEFSIIVPCYNEEHAILSTLDQLTQAVTGRAYEIIMVNDGSSDATGEILARIAAERSDVRVFSHTRNRGYGAALKTGIRQAGGELIVITDADGSYPIERIPELVDRGADVDMVVGARTAAGVQYSKLRAFPKIFLRIWASWIARQKIPDINSGLRVFRRDVAMKYFGILPNAFSFTLTITLATLTNFHAVVFVPITYHPRIGKSKIKPIRDTLLFLSLIARTGIYFAPIRLFAPLIFALFLVFLGCVIYDIAVLHDLTEKTLIVFFFLFNMASFALLADMIDKRTAKG